MGRVIPFSEIESYLTSIASADIHKGTILDTNILISAGYEVRDSHQDVVDLLEILLDADYRLFATVNTRSEYLEFQRRLILSENLFDLTDEFSKIRIPRDAKAKIQTLRGSLRTSVVADPEKDEVFNEAQLKKIKKELSAGTHSGQAGWLQICELFLQSQIELADQDLQERGVEYISSNDSSQAELFNSPLSWAGAIGLCEKTGTAFSDSMILNALKSSQLLFAVSLDFDLGYAALGDPNMKDIVVPDKLYREYKNYHFPI